LRAIPFFGTGSSAHVFFESLFPSLVDLFQKVHRGRSAAPFSPNPPLRVCPVKLRLFFCVDSSLSSLGFDKFSLARPRLFLPEQVAVLRDARTVLLLDVPPSFFFFWRMKSALPLPYLFPSVLAHGFCFQVRLSCSADCSRSPSSLAYPD